MKSKLLYQSFTLGLSLLGTQLFSQSIISITDPGLLTDNPDIDLNGDLNPEFACQNYYPESTLIPRSPQFEIFLPIQTELLFDDDPFNLLGLRPNDIVQPVPDIGFWDQGFYTYNGILPEEPWVKLALVHFTNTSIFKDGESAFLGFRFSDNTEYRYGYMELHLHDWEGLPDTNLSDPIPIEPQPVGDYPWVEVVAITFADSPNTPITVAPIPEQNSLPLALLGVIAICYRSMKICRFI